MLLYAKFPIAVNVILKTVLVVFFLVMFFYGVKALEQLSNDELMNATFPASALIASS